MHNLATKGIAITYYRCRYESDGQLDDGGCIWLGNQSIAGQKNRIKGDYIAGCFNSSLIAM